MTPIRLGGVRRAAAALVLGALLGLQAGALQAARQVQALRLERDRLRLELEELRERYARLEGDLAARRHPAVREVALEVRGVDDDAQRLELEQALVPLARSLLGRRVEHLDPDVVAAVFDGRLVRAGEREFRLRVRLLVLAERSRVVVVASPAGQEEEQEP